jgi:DNA topoisomerase-1
LDFRAGSRALAFDGFLKVYEEAPDEDEQPVPAESLPPLVDGQMLTLTALQPEMHTTQAPSRYTEAALVKALEERGIGRPSTYAGMVKTIKTKGYVRLEHKRLVPTEMGLKLCDLLTAKFGGLFDYGYTAQLEETLDSVAGGKTTRLAILQAFWANFQPLLQVAGAEAGTQPALQAPAGACPKCGSPLVERQGAFGPFIGCADFPKCRYTAGGPARPVRFSKKREDVKA